MDRQQLVTDYFVIGAGIAGLGFVDMLLKEDRDCTVAIADIFEKPGGKYNKWPGFCHLDGNVESWGVETMKFEGSTTDDILRYCEEVVKKLVKSGRVRFFPKHKANETGTILTHVLDPDRSYDVTVMRKVVDATCTSPRIPSGPKLDIEVDGSAQLVSPCSLSNLASAHSQYVVIGSGYIGTCTALWLLSAGVSPKKILWVMPRARRFRPKEMSATGTSGEALNRLTATLCTFPSLIGCAMMLEEAGLAVRPCARPDAELYNFRCLVSTEDMTTLRQVTNVIRSSYVSKISVGQMQFTDGRLYETAKDAMYIDCTGSRTHFQGKPEPVWQNNRIKLQRLQEGTLADISMSAAMCGMFEARMPVVDRHTETLKNALCTPLSFTDNFGDWLLGSIPRGNLEVWRQKDMKTLSMDRLGMRVNPAKSLEDLKHQRQWSEPEVIAKVTSNIMRVVTKEEPEAVGNFSWLDMPDPVKHQHAALRGAVARRAKVDTSAAVSATVATAALVGKVGTAAQDSNVDKEDSVSKVSTRASTQAPPSRRVSVDTDLAADSFFDFDVLDQVEVA